MAGVPWRLAAGRFVLPIAVFLFGALVACEDEAGSAGAGAGDASGDTGAAVDVPSDTVQGDRGGGDGSVDDAALDTPTADTGVAPDVVEGDSAPQPDLRDDAVEPDIAPQPCQAEIEALAALIYEEPARACTAVVRLDYESMSALGYQLVCGRYAGVDEETARSTAQTDAGYGAAATRISPESADDQLVFYETPGDFGGVATVSLDTGLTTFGGSIIWDGAGDITWPTEWRPASELGTGCEAVGSLPRARGYDLRTAEAITDQELLNLPLLALLDSAVTLAFWEGGYTFNAVVLLYPRSVGVFDPSTAEWIVLVNGGWLE